MDWKSLLGKMDLKSLLHGILSVGVMVHLISGGISLASEWIFSLKGRITFVWMPLAVLCAGQFWCQ